MQQKAKVRASVDKTMSVLLPVQIEDTVNEYTFTFKVEGAKIEGGETYGNYSL
jgi:hypothetical protein